MKKITKAQIRKKISEMTTEEKDALLLSLYQLEPLSFYFGGREYREGVIEEYKKKIEKIFNPSERALMTKGVDKTLALSLLHNYEKNVFTGDADLDSYYKEQLLKAHMTADPSKYEYSSYDCIVNEKEDNLIFRDRLLGLFHHSA